MISTMILSLSLSAAPGPFGDVAPGEQLTLESFPKIHIEVNTQAFNSQTRKTEVVRNSDDAVTLCLDRIDSVKKTLQERGLKAFYISPCKKYKDPSFPGEESKPSVERVLADIYLQP